MYSFPYETKHIEEGILVDPRVTLEVKTLHGFLPIKFLLDSGADVTSLPLTPYANSFQFTKDSSKRITIGGVEGRGIAAYPFEIVCRIETTEFSLRSYFIESNVDPLLGRLDFWNLFSVQFDNQKRQTNLTLIRPTFRQLIK